MTDDNAAADHKKDPETAPARPVSPPPTVRHGFISITPATAAPGPHRRRQRPRYRPPAGQPPASPPAPAHATVLRLPRRRCAVAWPSTVTGPGQLRGSLAARTRHRGQLLLLTADGTSGRARPALPVLRMEVGRFRASWRHLAVLALGAAGGGAGR